MAKITKEIITEKDLAIFTVSGEFTIAYIVETLNTNYAPGLPNNILRDCSCVSMSSNPLWPSAASMHRFCCRASIPCSNRIITKATPRKRAFESSMHIYLVVDECHRVSSPKFRQVVATFDSSRMLGMSAIYRRYLQMKANWYLMVVHH